MSNSLRDDRMDHFADDIGQSKPSTVVKVRQLFMIHPEQVQNGGVQIIHMHFVDRSPMADFI